MDLGRIRTLTSVSNVLIVYILDGISLSEAEQNLLLESVGLSPEKARDIHGRISVITLSRFWNEVLRLTGNDFAGLQIGLTVPASRFGLAVHAAENSDDFRQTLDRYAKFVKLINNLIHCELSEISGSAHLSMKFYWDLFDLERHAVDIAFACIKVWASQNVPGFKIQSLHLRHNLEAKRGDYERIFEAPVSFRAKISEIVFASPLLDVPIARGKPDLGLILDHYATEELSKVPVLTHFPARVSQIISTALRSGNEVDLPKVSDELKMTDRQLQRKLQESSTSFSVLLDEARKLLAAELLLRDGANVEQVGFHLGYAESTAFIRAFKKWYGVTPGEYRRNKA